MHHTRHSIRQNPVNPVKEPRTSSRHVHHALCLNSLGGSYTLALGSCIIASSDFAITKATTSGNVRASASTPHPSHKPRALRALGVSASPFRTSSHHARNMGCSHTSACKLALRQREQDHVQRQALVSCTAHTTTQS